MAFYLLQLSAQGDKILWIYVGKNVGMWAKTWAVNERQSQNFRREF